MGERLSARSAATPEHGYGTDSDCVCGRNFATVRGLREHLTKHHLAAASPTLDPFAWGCDHHAEPATCLSVGEPEERCCRVCRRVAADRLIRAIARSAATPDTTHDCDERVRVAVERERELGLDLHRAYRPEVAAEVCVHLGSHEDWTVLAVWCGGTIQSSQDPSGEYTSTLVLPDGQAGGEWAWLCRDATGAFTIRAEVTEVVPSEHVRALVVAPDTAAQALRDAGDAAARALGLLDTALCRCGHKIREHGTACESCEIEDRPAAHPHPAQRRCARSYGSFVLEVRAALDPGTRTAHHGEGP